MEKISTDMDMKQEEVLPKKIGYLLQEPTEQQHKLIADFRFKVRSVFASGEIKPSSGYSRGGTTEKYWTLGKIAKAQAVVADALKKNIVAWPWFEVRKGVLAGYILVEIDNKPVATYFMRTISAAGKAGATSRDRESDHTFYSRRLLIDFFYINGLQDLEQDEFLDIYIEQSNPSTKATDTATQLAKKFSKTNGFKNEDTAPASKDV